jgi:hypothetical protein
MSTMSTMPTVAAMTEQMHPDERSEEQDPNPVLRNPFHGCLQASQLADGIHKS